MTDLDRLIRDYKLQTGKGIKQVRLQKKLDLGSIIIGTLIGTAVLAIFFNYDLKWYFGRNVPWYIDWFAVFLLTLNVRLRQYVSWIIFGSFAIGLVCVYAGVPLPLIK